MATQGVAGCDIAGFHVFLAAEHGLNLKLEVELEVVQGVDFSCQAQDALHPGVAGLEDLGLLAVFQDAIDEGQDCNHSALLVGLIEQALQVQVLVADGLVLLDSQVTQPVAQVLQQGALTSLHRPTVTSLIPNTHKSNPHGKSNSYTRPVAELLQMHAELADKLR